MGFIGEIAILILGLYLLGTELEIWSEFRGGKK